MPKKKNYPTWFSQYSPPYCPGKPPKFLEGYSIIKKFTVNSGDNVPLHEVPKDTMLRVSSVHQSEMFSDSVDFECVQITKQVNPNYEQLLRCYQEDYKNCKEKRKEWNELKKRWDQEAAQENERRELKLYYKLKKKLKV